MPTCLYPNARARSESQGAHMGTIVSTVRAYEQNAVG